MNQMEIFKNPEFGSIRTFEQDGKVLFCGTDVAAALGYANPRKAVRDHTRCGTKCSVGVQTGKKADGSPAVQMVEMLFIPEGDVYRLIVHSKLPSAERFERWVFDEVLPTIRQHGAYLTRDKLWEVATSPEALLKLCTDLLAEREKNTALREDNARLQSKAVYYDLFIDLDHSTNLRTTAKELDVPERRFVRFLLERRFVYRTPSGCVLPYAKSANDGLFCVRDYPKEPDDCSREQTCAGLGEDDVAVSVFRRVYGCRRPGQFGYRAGIRAGAGRLLEAVFCRHRTGNYDVGRGVALRPPGGAFEP